MRVEKITLNSHDHERFHFTTKRTEISILSALLAHAYRNTPPHHTTEIFRAHCRGMMRSIDKALKMSAENSPQPTESTP
jgi:hypothetical protein